MEKLREMMEETILFDLDGTLTDPKLGITRCVRYALESFGIVEEDLSRLECFIGPPLKEQFMEYAGFSEEQAAQAVAKYRERFQTVGIFENGVFDGISDMLESLRLLGFRIGLASSKPEVYARRILEHFGLIRFMDEVTGSELSGERTRKAEVIAEAMRRMGTTPAQTIMVGDRKHDVEGAREKGLFCIGVLFGYGSREELTQAGADYLCATVAELQKALSERVWRKDR